MAIANRTCVSFCNILYHHHHHHLEIYSAPITFAAIGAVQKSYEQQTLTNIKSKGKIMGF